MTANTDGNDQELMDWVLVDYEQQDNQSFHSARSQQSTAETPLLAQPRSTLPNFDLQQKLNNGAFGQCLSGELMTKHGIVVDKAGVHIPDFSPRPLAWGIAGFVVAALSGASGYMGGYDALGIPGGIGSWLATSGLNLDGVIQLIIWWIESAGVPCSFGLVLTIFTAIFLAAAPPAVLAAQGALKTDDHN